MLNNGKQVSDESEVDKEDELIAELQKKKMLKRIADSKATQINTQIKAQKKKNAELDKEIEEIRKTIQDKLDLNEKMSKRAKELKGMIVEKKQSVKQNYSRGPMSPKQSDSEKAEL